MLRTAASFVTSLGGVTRDSSHARWSETEKWAALNYALEQMAGKVFFPVPWEIDLSISTQTYDLPYWANGERVDLHVYDTDDYAGTTVSNQQWKQYAQWEQRTATDGTTDLDVKPGHSADATATVWMTNGRVPKGTFTASASSSATTITVTTSEMSYELPDVGFALLGTEWVLYRGLDRGSYPSSIDLLYVLRAQSGTTAATYSGETLFWGVYYDHPGLPQVIEHMGLAYLSRLPLINASQTEISHHQWNLRWATQEARAFWRNYAPARGTRVRRAMNADVGRTM